MTDISENLTSTVGDLKENSSAALNITRTDVAIIGAGPVGLFAVFQCGMMKLKCHVIDALEHVGGQCTALYPEKPIYDIPALPEIKAADLIHNLERQIKSFNPVYHLNQNVITIKKMDDGWYITTSKGSLIQAKVIIIAAGVGAFGPNKPPLKDLEIYEATSVDYHIKHKEKYRGKKVVIAGGGDSAVDWALNLATIAQKVYLVHRRTKFRAAPNSIDQLNALNNQGVLELVTPYQLSALGGTHGILEHITVENLDGQSRTLEANYLLPFFGLSMDLGPISEWGLSLENKYISVDPSTMQTSVDSIFAIGDVATYKNKLKLILCGFAEAAQAAHQARMIVYPGEAFHFEYSTTSGVPELIVT